MLNTLIEDTRNALIGLVLLVVSLPFYYYWTKTPVSAHENLAPKGQ